jgi:hypothetical protein
LVSRLTLSLKEAGQVGGEAVKMRIVGRAVAHDVRRLGLPAPALDARAPSSTMRGAPSLGRARLAFPGLRLDCCRFRENDSKAVGSGRPLHG